MPVLLPITAIIPVADRPALVTDAIRSICTGTARPAELLVIYNGRNSRASVADDADREAVTAAFAEHKSSGIALRSTVARARGPGPARNQGVAEARQAWLAFLDSDDLWAPEKLERQWQYLKQRPHLHAVHTAEEWYRDGRLLQQPAHLRAHAGRFLQASFSHCLISCSSIVMRRSVFRELGGFDPRFRVCEDFELWLRYLVRYPIGLVPEALTIKRAGDWPQESRRFHSLDRLRVRAILKLIQTSRSELSSADIAAALAACRHKLTILSQGAAKYGAAAERRVAQLSRAIDERFA